MSRICRAVISYEKQISSKVYYFEQIRDKKRESTADTMYIKATTPRATSSKNEGVARTSETFGGSDTNRIASEIESGKSGSSNPPDEDENNIRFSITSLEEPIVPNDRRTPLDHMTDAVMPGYNYGHGILKSVIGLLTPCPKARCQFPFRRFNIFAAPILKSLSACALASISLSHSR